MPGGPCKYLTAQTSRQEEMDTNSLERLQRPGYTAPATHCPACTPAQKCMGRYIRNQDAQEDCCPGCKGKNKTKNTGKVHHDRNEAGTQHNKTISTASCKLATHDHSRQAHQPGSIQACFANAAAKENAAKQQLAPGNAVCTNSLTLLQKPPAKDDITVVTEMHLQHKKLDADCNMSLDTTKKTRKARQASTLSETCRAGMTSHTNKQPGTTQEKQRKVAGAYSPCCDTMTVLTWNVMGSTTGAR